MIDLRSDTLTKPTREMLETVLSAQLGDAGRVGENGRGEDPTVNQLEDYAAALLHKEAAAFVCSGTMGNSAALLTRCRPGGKILVDRMQHVYRAEDFTTNSRFGQLCAVHYDSDARGLPIPQSVEEQMKHQDIDVLQLENTLNSYGGVCVPLALHQELYDIARRYGVWIHLDGARLFNAALALGVEAWEIAQYADSVMFCVSKGVGAPFGSLVCGPESFIRELRTTQKYLGGGLRQAGIMAAPALYALQHQIPRMVEDHRHASYTAQALRDLKHLRPQEQVESNIVMLDLVDCPAERYCKMLKQRGVVGGPVSESRVRLVFYREIGDQETEEAVRIIRALDQEMG